MRILKFIIDGLSITQDPECDFSGLVPGTEGYLWAEFSFSNEWSDCVKVAKFTSIMGKEYEPKALEGDKCLIPAEALARRSFKIQIMGRGSNKRLLTNKITINQDGGKT